MFSVISGHIESCYRFIRHSAVKANSFRKNIENMIRTLIWIVIKWKIKFKILVILRNVVLNNCKKTVFSSI